MSKTSPDLAISNPVTGSESESELRARLGIPSAATTVLVIAESTHWDPNWLLTSDEYYRASVRRTLDRVIEVLVSEPRRVFSLECIFFVECYWRDHPGRRELFRDLVNQGRICFTGSGVTTPDTLLPEDELLLRDLLLGQEWLRTHQMTAEPRLLYLPDSFGHSPGLPSLLQASGFPYAAVTRIDGMRFPGADMESARNFPRPGSSAEHLINAGTSDFVWRSSDGSEVLTHWMAHGYGHGDMIASGGLSRFMGLPLAWSDRRDSHVDRRVASYLDDLDQLSLTPYQLLNIGFDFVRPVPRLVELIDSWNDRHHDRTGTWLVNATTEDYLDLVSFHKSSLPTIDFDPNPYWTGFYSSRPSLKSAARDLGRRLIAGDAGQAVEATKGTRSEDWTDSTDSQSAWWAAAISNHHDFITGTAPDRVARGEQERILRQAIAKAPWPEKTRPEKTRPEKTRPDKTGTTFAGTTAAGSTAARTRSVSAQRSAGSVVLNATWGTAVFDPRRGGTLVSLITEGGEQISGPSFGLRSYKDSGGLWRMGQEIHGGSWSLSDDSALHPATVDLTRRGDIATVRIHPVVESRVATIEINVDLIDPEGPTFMVRTALTAALRRTVTLSVVQQHGSSGLHMHQPGGMVSRNSERWYRPTFWPLHSFAATACADSADRADREQMTRGLVVATATPTGIHQDDNGTVEVVIARTAVKEIAFGAMPVLSPAWGMRWGEQSASLAFRWIDGNEDSQIRSGRALWRFVDEQVGRHRPDWPIEIVDGADPDNAARPGDVEIVAVKPAHRGDGIVVRLRDWGAVSAESRAEPRPVTLSVADVITSTIRSAALVDARERDRIALDHDPRRVTVHPVDHLTSIRLVFSSSEVHDTPALPT